MKKLAALVALVAIIGASFYRLPRDIDALVAEGIAFHGSMMTKTVVSTSEAHIAGASGKGTITNLSIGNPSGFSTKPALKAEHIHIEIDMESIASDVIVVRTIIVDGPDVTYEKGDGMTNFDAIHRNIASYLGKRAAKLARLERKIIVEELTVCNSKALATASFMDGKAISIPLPDFTLRNLGKAKGGFTPAELGEEVTSAVSAKLASAVSFDRLMRSSRNTPDQAEPSVKGPY